MLRALTQRRDESISWVVASPTSPDSAVRARYEHLCAQRRFWRSLGLIAPQIARSGLWGSWPGVCLANAHVHPVACPSTHTSFSPVAFVELEPYILNELARKGSFYTRVKALRERCYDDSIDLYINAWVAMIQIAVSPSHDTDSHPSYIHPHL